jgi:hypothetical protein
MIYDLYFSPNIIRIIISKGMRWAGHVARIGQRSSAVELGWGNLREREFGRSRCRGKKLLKCISN